MIDKDNDFLGCLIFLAAVAIIGLGLLFWVFAEIIPPKYIICN